MDMTLAKGAVAAAIKGMAVDANHQSRGLSSCSGRGWKGMRNRFHIDRFCCESEASRGCAGAVAGSADASASILSDTVFGLNSAVFQSETSIRMTRQRKYENAELDTSSERANDALTDREASS